MYAIWNAVGLIRQSLHTPFSQRIFWLLNAVALIVLSLCFASFPFYLAMTLNRPQLFNERDNRRCRNASASADFHRFQLLGSDKLVG